MIGDHFLCLVASQSFSLTILRSISFRWWNSIIKDSSRLVRS